MKKGRLRTKEKAKRGRRRSGWKHYFVLFVVLIGLWLSLGYYFGHQAEQAFKYFLQTQTEIAGEKLIRFELLRYDKRWLGALGATARLRVSSDVPAVAERIGEISISAKLLNGPIFITKQGVSTGSSRWLFKIEENNASQSELENLRVIFPDQFPKLIVRTDFKHQAHYFSRMETSIAKLILSGYYKFETDEQNESNHGSIQVEGLKLGVKPATLHADQLSISYQQSGQAVSAGYKPGVTAIRSSLITIKHPYFKQAVSISLVAKSDLSIEKGLLQGFVKVDFEQKNKQKELPFEVAKVRLTFKGLSADGVVAVSDAKADLDNLKQQVNWTLEDMGAYPEGQDEIIHLKDQIKSSQKALDSAWFNKLFHGNGSQYKLELSTQKDDSESKVTAVLNKSKAAQQSQKKADSMHLKGEIVGSLSDEWQRYLSTLIRRMGKDELITVNKNFKVDLERSIRLFE